MNVEIIKSSRKTIVVEIKPDLRVIVRAPLKMKDKNIHDFVNQKSDWIKKNIEIMKARNATKEQDKLPTFTEKEITELTIQAKAYLPFRVEHFAKIMGMKYGKITIRHQISRWGSCSSKGNLNFNCLLMLCPENVRDYVIIHELCHLKELNHSPRFWAEVERYCPGYKVCKEWLKANGSVLIERIKE